MPKIVLLIVTQKIVITDLDGTLLHPRTYSFEEAQAALELIKAKKVPLILCSSKTRIEIEEHRRSLGNHSPFISENGGGIFIPDRYFDFPVEGKAINGYKVIITGKPYSEIRAIFNGVRERTGINVRGFGDMDTNQVAVLTGLKKEDAERATAREFDEPFVFAEGEERVSEFLAYIEEAGLHWTRGMFYHILGDNDKGKAIRILMRFYKRAYGNICTAGLGDSLNDLPLLQNVDYPYLMQKEDGSYTAEITIPNIIKASGVGPAGWNNSVIRFIGE